MDKYSHISRELKPIICAFTIAPMNDFIISIFVVIHPHITAGWQCSANTFIGVTLLAISILISNQVNWRNWIHCNFEAMRYETSFNWIIDCEFEWLYNWCQTQCKICEWAGFVLLEILHFTMVLCNQISKTNMKENLWI